ncbi:MAG: HD domain-containing protein [Nitrospirae bacterium]|nr:HD domain-containing protein [Nitrospirota bacterium]
MTLKESLVDRVVDLEDQIKRMCLIGIALTSERNLKVLLEKIVHEARGFVGADAGSLYIVEHEQLSFEVAQNDSLERAGKMEPFNAFKMPLNEKSIAGYVALRGELLMIGDVYTLPPTVPYQFNRAFDERTGYRSKSILAIPMRDHEEQIIGVLQLLNKLDGNGAVQPFSASDRDISYSLASQAAISINNVRLVKELKTTFNALVTYCGVLVDARSRHTAGHTVRVAEYTMRLADAVTRQQDGPFKEVKLSEDQLEEIYIAAYLHDIGKIGVRETVLDKENKLTKDQLEAIRQRFHYVKERTLRECFERIAREGLGVEGARKTESEAQEKVRQLEDDLKFVEQVYIPTVVADDKAARLQEIAKKRYTDPSGQEQPLITEFEYENLSIRRGSLTSKERKEIEDHVVKSIEILTRIPFPKHLKNVCVYAGGHHEKLDGSGYPNGIKGDALPLQARMIALCDFFDALTAYDRPYKKPVPVERSYSIIEEEGKQNKIDLTLLDLFRKEKLHEGIVEEAAKPPHERKYPDGIQSPFIKQILGKAN